MNPDQNPDPTPVQPVQPAAEPDYDKPVAYDAQGRPLYAHPPVRGQAPNGVDPRVVYVARPLEPEAPRLTAEIEKRHNEACERYPHLNLSKGEYIISEVRRHPIGLLAGWFLTLVIMVVLAGLAYVFINNPGNVLGIGTLQNNTGAQAGVAFVTVVLCGLVFVGGMLAAHIYRQNRFYLTNESVIQNIQYNLFSKRQQTISLENIEDASYAQRGVLPHIFNYGQLRLSTQGDENTYRFNYASDPERQIALLNNAVEAFKLGRPVENT
jgi:hypothetical protein